MQLLSLFVLVGVARAQISFETEVGLPSESCLELLFKFAGAPAPTRVSCSLPGDPASRALLPEHRIDGSSRWQLRICAPDERPLLVLGPTSNSFACVFEGAAVNATVRVASDPIRILPRGQTGAVTVWSVSVRRRPRQPMPRILDVAAVATQPGAHCLQVAWDPGWDEDGQMALVDRLCRSKLDNALPKGTISQVRLSPRSHGVVPR